MSDAQQDKGECAERERILSLIDSVIWLLHQKSMHLRRKPRQNLEDVSSLSTLHETIDELRRWYSKEAKLSGEDRAREDIRVQFLELLEKSVQLALKTGQ